MAITYEDRLRDAGYFDITPEQEREIEARAECERRGIDPDEICADGGVTAWMVVDREAEGQKPLPYDRDTLGRFVREAWVRWAQTQPDPKPSWLVPYDELPEADKEADRQIGETVARWTLIGDGALEATSADVLRDAIQWCLDRDQRNGSLPEAYAERLRAAIAKTSA